MIEAKFDMPKLIKSLEAAAKNFGETNKNAVARWGVQTCRALAVSTQAFGKTGTRKKQRFAIESDARRVIYPVDSIKPSKTGKSVRASHEGKNFNWPNDRVLRNETEVNDWIDRHREKGKHRTAKLPFPELAICTMTTFRKAVKVRDAKSGMAKGAWLGAGAEIALKQTGMDRINIGKNFLSYAQKHSGRGDASVTNDLFRPIGKLINKARHSGSNYVLTAGTKAKAVGFGLQQAIRWYHSAARKALDK